MENVSLDVPERQVLVYYEDDAVPWHHRLLLHHIAEARWIWVTPDLEVQAGGVAAQPVRTLGRSAPVPADCRPCYLFDELPPDQLAGIRSEATRLAEVLGVTLATQPDAAREALWLYADPAYEKFNEEVEGDRLHPGRCVVKGSTALVDVSDGPDADWTFAEHVLATDRDEWLDDKRSGAGRDARLNAVTRTDGGVRRALLRDAVDSMRPVAQNGWPFRGPPAIREVLAGIVASGMEPPAYHSHWKQASGVSPNGAVCAEHFLLVNMIWMMACYDQYDLYNSATAEQAARRLLMIQRAVRRNPRCPDFENLECFLASALDQSGGVTTLEFDKHIAEIQKVEAQVLKQHRLAREEQEADDRRKRGGGAGGDKNGGGRKNQKDGGAGAPHGP